MSRYTGANCKLCRRDGTKLMLKGTRCMSDRCALENRNYPPGMRTRMRMSRSSSDYGVQLREKQKMKRTYGMSEKQFRNFFKKADKKAGATGGNLLTSLECRLDNVVFRLGFATSRKAARQLVMHRHFSVDEKITDIPSYQVSPGQQISVREKSNEIVPILEGLKLSEGRDVLPWLTRDTKAVKGVMVDIPNVENTPIQINTQLVVELYSK